MFSNSVDRRTDNCWLDTEVVVIDPPAHPNGEVSLISPYSINVLKYHVPVSNIQRKYPGLNVSMNTNPACIKSLNNDQLGLMGCRT